VWGIWGEGATKAAKQRRNATAPVSDSSAQQQALPSARNELGDGLHHQTYISRSKWLTLAFSAALNFGD